MPSNPTPRPGDHVELTIRGVYRERDNNDSVLPHLIETHAGAMQWIPDGDLRVVDPPEPTTVGTVVTGWATPDVTYPETMFVYVRTGTDDGSACWQAPGSAYEYEWPAVLADTLHSRRIIAPPDGAA